MIQGVRCATLFAAFVMVFGAVAISEAGTFTYSPGSWGSFTGTGAGTPPAYVANPDPLAISPDLTLTSSSATQNFNLGATYTYTIVWTPASGSDPVPKSVTATFNKSANLSAYGTGVSTLLQGTNQLLEMDSTNNFVAGTTTFLSQVTVTSPFVQQPNGSYIATGTVTTDTLNVTWNSGAGGQTSCEESFTFISAVGGF